MKQLRPVIVAATTLVLAASHTSLASGSYCVCLPKPPAKAASGKVDRDKYDLGQKVFNGKTAPAVGDAALQRPQLEAWQARLPGKTARTKNLPALAGRLTSQQLEALGYFVEQRYPIAK